MLSPCLVFVSSPFVSTVNGLLVMLVDEVVEWGLDWSMILVSPVFWSWMVSWKDSESRWRVEEIWIRFLSVIIVNYLQRDRVAVLIGWFGGWFGCGMRGCGVLETELPNQVIRIACIGFSNTGMSLSFMRDRPFLASQNPDRTIKNRDRALLRNAWYESISTTITRIIVMRIRDFNQQRRGNRYIPSVRTVSLGLDTEQSYLPLHYINHNNNFHFHSQVVREIPRSLVLFQRRFRSEPSSSHGEKAYRKVLSNHDLFCHWSKLHTAANSWMISSTFQNRLQKDTARLCFDSKNVHRFRPLSLCNAIPTPSKQPLKTNLTASLRVPRYFALSMKSPTFCY